MIKDKIDKYPFFIEKMKDTKNIENQCCARSMGHRYSDIRCPRPCHKDTDYCKLHNKRLS